MGSEERLQGKLASQGFPAAGTLGRRSHSLLGHRGAEGLWLGWGFHGFALWRRKRLKL